MANLILLRNELNNSIDSSSDKVAYFFKTDPGDYAAHDKFLGVTVPTIRKLARKFVQLSTLEVDELLTSQFNEERLLALLILVHQYEKADSIVKQAIYQFYLDHLIQVNNWNLVDLSAHKIVGVHLLEKDKQILRELAESPIMWKRRVAIVSTWWFIRNNQLEWTFKLAEKLLHDEHDLMHKAVGWMLREAGKRNQHKLVEFLDCHISLMPRTMLRYSIERFPTAERKAYLKKR